MSKITVKEQCKILLEDGKIINQELTSAGMQWEVAAYGQRYLVTRDRNQKYTLTQIRRLQDD